MLKVPGWWREDGERGAEAQEGAGRPWWVRLFARGRETSATGAEVAPAFS